MDRPRGITIHLSVLSVTLEHARHAFPYELFGYTNCIPYPIKHTTKGTRISNKGTEINYVFHSSNVFAKHNSSVREELFGAVRFIAHGNAEVLN